MNRTHLAASGLAILLATLAAISASAATPAANSTAAVELAHSPKHFHFASLPHRRRPRHRGSALRGNYRRRQILTHGRARKRHRRASRQSKRNA